MLLNELVQVFHYIAAIQKEIFLTAFLFLFSLLDSDICLAFR